MFVINSYIAFQSPVSVEYPPPPGLNTNSTTITTASYGNGTYITSSSSINQLNQSPWKAFDKFNADGTLDYQSGWAYNGAGGVYEGGFTTIISSVSTPGERISLLLPSAIVLKSYSIQSGLNSSGDLWKRSPFTWKLAGSNDAGATWTLIDSAQAATWTAYSQIQTFSIPSNTTPYNNYRLVVTSIQDASYGYLLIGELRLFSSTIFNEYPPSPGMTANSTNISTASYGNGTYLSAAANEGGGLSFNAFNKINPNWLAWGTDVGLFPNTNGVYTGTAFSIPGFGNGLWIRLTMPSAITLTGYSIEPMVPDSGATLYLRAPTAWKVLGSNNGGTTYTQVDTQTIL
jgi:hypothetical protein